MEEQPARLLAPDATAKRLGISVETLRTWRSRKSYSLKYVKVGRSVRYRECDVEDFIAARTRDG